MNSSEGVSLLSRFVEWILSFYQSAVNGLIGIFSGSGAGSALSWLMRSWKSLFAFLLISGVIANIVIYVIRWKPHWWWFAKKRMVVNDELLQRRGKGKKSAKPAAARPAAKPSTIVPRKGASETLKLSTIAPSPAGDLMESEFDDLLSVHEKSKKNS